MEKDILTIRQNYTLDLKIEFSKKRIKEWYDTYIEANTKHKILKEDT